MRCDRIEGFGMPLIKRLAIWLLETSLEVLLMGLALIALLGHDQHAFGRSLLAYSTWIVLFSFTTGYLLTTVVARGTWRGQSGGYTLPSPSHCSSSTQKSSSKSREARHAQSSSPWRQPVCWSSSSPQSPVAGSCEDGRPAVRAGLNACKVCLFGGALLRLGLRLRGVPCQAKAYGALHRL
jgi:hypothetical protein